MDINQMVSTAPDAITVRRVYGEPIERHGATVITAARVTGGVGGGSGREREQQGEGGGFGLSASPIGAFVIKDGTVRWVPAIDLQRILTTVGVVVIGAHLARAWRMTRAIKAGGQTTG